MTEVGKPNVGADMIRIHRAITRGIEVSLERSTAFAEAGFPSAAEREGFLTYLRALSGVLDAHHLGEDEVAFPAFREKTPSAPFERLMADHREIVGVLGDLAQNAAVVAEGAGSGDSVRALNGILVNLTRLWHPHIAIEESLWGPEAIATLMNDEENLGLGQKLGETSQKHLHAPDIEIPFVLYNLSPEDRADMTKAMPPVVVQQLVPLVWHAKWAPMKPFLLE